MSVQIWTNTVGGVGLLYTFPGILNGAAVGGGTGGFEMEEEQIRTRADMSPRANGHGSAVVGDGLCDGKLIRIKGAFKCDTHGLMKAEMDKLKQYAYLSGSGSDGYQLRLTQYPDRYIVINGVEDLTITWVSQTAAEVELTFIAPDPYWYSTTRETHQSATITIPAGGSITTLDTVSACPITDAMFGTPPTVEVCVTSGGVLAGIVVRNKMYGNRGFRFSRPLAAATENKVVVNMATGAVAGFGGSWGSSAAGTDVIRMIEWAYWYMLANGNNTIEIAASGTSGTKFYVKHYWRRRYL